MCSKKNNERPSKPTKGKLKTANYHGKVKKTGKDKPTTGKPTTKGKD